MPDHNAPEKRVGVPALLGLHLRLGELLLNPVELALVRHIPNCCPCLRTCGRGGPQPGLQRERSRAQITMRMQPCGVCDCGQMFPIE